MKRTSKELDFAVKKADLELHTGKLTKLQVQQICDAARITELQMRQQAVVEEKAALCVRVETEKQRAVLFDKQQIVAAAHMNE